ncbi:hypothetical protein ACRRTK_004850 [Alexandromys fortis]
METMEGMEKLERMETMEAPKEKESPEDQAGAEKPALQVHVNRGEVQKAREKAADCQPSDAADGFQQKKNLRCQILQQLFAVVKNRYFTYLQYDFSQTPDEKQLKGAESVCFGISPRKAGTLLLGHTQRYGPNRLHADVFHCQPFLSNHTLWKDLEASNVHCCMGGGEYYSPFEVLPRILHQKD